MHICRPEGKGRHSRLRVVSSLDEAGYPEAKTASR